MSNTTINQLAAILCAEMVNNGIASAEYSFDGHKLQVIVVYPKEDNHE